MFKPYNPLNQIPYAINSHIPRNQVDQTRQFVVDAYRLVKVCVLIDPELYKVDPEKHVQDIAHTTTYWGTGMYRHTAFLWETGLRAEDIGHSLSTPEGAKLKSLFDWGNSYNCGGMSGGKEIVKVYYLNIPKFGNGSVGMCYGYNGHMHIVMSSYKGKNVFAHELGHAIYHSNPALKGKDPISGESHSNDENNLMFPTVPFANAKIEPKQVESVNGSYVVYPSSPTLLEYSPTDFNIAVKTGAHGLTCECGENL